jgi:hypothetical protein
MTCVKCKKRKGVILIKSLGKKACKDCFKKIVFKRFSKSITNNKLIGKKEKILVLLRNSNDKVLLYLMELLAKKHKGLTVYSGMKKIGGLKVLNQENLTDIAIRVLAGFLKNKKELLDVKHGPLELLSDYDLETYAGIIGITYAPVKRKGFKKDVLLLIKNLEETRKGLSYSIKGLIEDLT